MQQLKIIFLFIFLSPLTIVVGQTTPVDSIKGRVTDVQHHILSNATVMLKHEGSTDKIIQSDARGVFFFAPVFPGSYVLEITMVGFTTLRQNFFLLARRNCLPIWVI